MCVIGHEAVIINKSGRHAEVNAFTKEVEKLHQVPIVDASI